MAAPTVTASLNKAAYALGETMTLTVTYSDTDQQSGTVTVIVTDNSGNSSVPLVNAFVIDPLTISVTSVPSRVWTKVSDTGSVAVFTAVA